MIRLPGGQAPHAIQWGRPPSDFDFLFGSWQVRHHYLVERLVGCTGWVEFDGRASCLPILEGIGNIDEIRTPSRGVTGMTVRLCDADTGAWSIRWTTTATGWFEPPVYGSFHDQRGGFEGDDVFNGMPIGRPVRVGRNLDNVCPVAPKHSPSTKA